MSKENGQESKNVLQKGTEIVGKQAKRKIFKTVILPILLVALKYIVIAFAIYFVIASIKNFLKGEDSKESKNASNTSISYGDTIKVNKINVDMKNINKNGAYNLVYQFTDENGKNLSEKDAIAKIKEDLQSVNEKIKTDKFSDSELKIIGSLMYNGLEAGKYNEEQLKALAMFVKADIAGYSFDLRDEKKEVKIEDLRKNDEVYGTLELYKTTATNDKDGKPIYKQIKLSYIPYANFLSLVENQNNSVLTKFSIDNDGNIAIAKSSYRTIKYEYKNKSGGNLSDAEIGRIDDFYKGENEDEFVIKEYTVSIDYKEYIKKYVANYGFLSDLLLTTNNVDFCLEIAELGLNSKIALNIREEQVDINTKQITDYKITTLFYDYVAYKVTGYKVTEIWTDVATGTTSENDKTIETNGFKVSISNGQYTVSRYDGKDKDPIETKTNKNSGGDLIAKGTISESYDNYSINEAYSRQEIFNCDIIKTTFSRNFKYDLDISEIDCWYLLYKRPYIDAVKEIKELEPPEDEIGQFPQEATDVPGVSGEAQALANELLEQKKKELLSNPEINEVDEGNITSINTKKKEKTDALIAFYEGKRTIYKFGDEANIDTTQVKFKNMEYVNGKPSYTEAGEKGFLYIYDQYIQKGIDLYLHNDAEKQLFEMLEAEAETAYTSDIMRFLLYVYDGIDRGIIDLDKTFKIIETTLTTFYEMEANAFGVNMTREKFISKAQAYGASELSKLAPQFYDICSKYNINPCLAYGWAAFESAFGAKTLESRNLFQMGSDNGSETDLTYFTYEESIEEFCKWLVNSASPSSFNYSYNLERAKEYAKVNEKFDGAPDKSIYVLFCRNSWVGNTHTEDTRERIRKAYEFLSGGASGCNHSDSEETTIKERADYAQYQIELRLKIAEDIFGKNIFLRDDGGYENGTTGGSSNGSTTDGDFTIGGNESSDLYYGGKEAQAGTYISASKRQYVEWIQGYGPIGQKKLHYDGDTMGSAGCRSIWMCYISKLYWN